MAQARLRTTRFGHAIGWPGYSILTDDSAGRQVCRRGVSIPIDHTQTTNRFPSSYAALADAEYVVYQKLGALRLYLDKIYASSDINWGGEECTQSHIDDLCMGVRKASGIQVDELRLALTTNPPDECLLLVGNVEARARETAHHVAAASLALNDSLDFHTTKRAQLSYILLTTEAEAAEDAFNLCVANAISREHGMQSTDGIDSSMPSVSSFAALSAIVVPTNVYSYEDRMPTVADEGNLLFSKSGRPYGPDGRPMQRRAPLSDWELLAARQSSINRPGTRLPNKKKVTGSSSGFSEAARIVAAEMDAERLERIAAERLNSMHALELQAKRQTEKKFFRQQNKLAATTAKALRKAAHRLKRVKRDAVASTSTEFVAQPVDVDFNLQEPAALSQRDVSSTLFDKMDVVLQASAATTHSNAVLIPNLDTPMFTEDRISLKSIDRVKSKPGRLVRVMLDTGAGATLLTTRTGSLWPGKRHDRIRVIDVHGAESQALGGTRLSAQIRDVSGVWRTEVLAERAYESPTFDIDLLAVATLPDGWHIELETGGSNSCTMRSPTGYQYSLESTDGQHYLHMILGADAVENSTSNRSVLFAAPVRVRNIVRAHDSRRNTVRWAVDEDKDAVGTIISPEESQNNAAPETSLRLPTESVFDVLPTAKSTADDEREVRLVQIRLRIEREEAAYHTVHCAFNHDDVAVAKMMHDKTLKGVRKPKDFICPACQAADNKGAFFSGGHAQPTDVKPTPYHTVQIDLWGPLDVDDPDGNRYAFLALDEASDKLFFQPLRAKSDATQAMKAYLALIRAQAPTISAKLNVIINGVAIVKSDRGGEFTTTFGYTMSEFDTLLTDCQRVFNTPDTPQSGTTRVERKWGMLSTGARTNLYESGFKRRLYFHAMEMFATVHNWIGGGDGNKIAPGVAPDETLGLRYNLDNVVPFGSIATLRMIGDKGDDVTERVFVIGYGVDGAGYRVLRLNGSIVLSVHVKVEPNVAPRRQFLQSIRDDPSKAATIFEKRTFEFLPQSVDICEAVKKCGVADLSATVNDRAAEHRLTPRSIGAMPGHGGNNATKLPRATSPVVLNASKDVPIMSRDEAIASIVSARASGQILRWRHDNPKHGGSISFERYNLYRHALTFDAWDIMTRETFLSAKGTMQPKAKKEDLVNDIARGFCRFVLPDMPVLGIVPNVDPVMIDAAEDIGELAPISDMKANMVIADAINTGSATASTRVAPWQGRLRVRASSAKIGHLSVSDKALLDLGRDTDSAYFYLPEVVIRAAAAATMNYSTERGHMHSVPIPRTLQEAERSAEWPQWREALRTELGGIIDAGVWDEVPSSVMPTGVTAAPLMYIFSIKADGTFKVRLVVRGDMTEKGVHFLDTKSSMAAVESTRLLVSFAASEDWALYHVDFTQAFVNTPEENPHMYCELPILPQEFRDGTFGRGGTHKRGSFKPWVAHMRKVLYGEADAGRSWQRFLCSWLMENMDVRFYIHDRCVFEWEWNGHALRGEVHVDDILFAVSDDPIRAEFVRKLKSRFKITGGVLEATEFCGIEIRRDWNAKTITLHQEKFAQKLMDKYNMRAERDEPTPYPVSGAALQPSLEEVIDIDAFDYMCFVGDLTWYSRTNPGLAWRASDLARFMQRPGAEHVSAAKHVLRYIKGRLGAGLTYHGSKGVLTQSYDHTNKLIAAIDADFIHSGGYATSGAIVLHNGAAIAWKVRTQTTVSNTTAEAEVKACSVGVEMIRYLVGLHGEITHTAHGAVRTMVDSIGAESQIVHGMDNKSCASYKRAQAYCEDANDSALFWLDHVPGVQNPSDLMTKSVRNISEFRAKCDVLCGVRPHLFQSVAVVKLLSVAV